MRISFDARRAIARRAFSLVELLAVLGIMGVVTSMVFLRFGASTYEGTTAEGFSRSLMLHLQQARASTISTGDNHFLQLSRQGGKIASYTIYRDTGGGDLVVDSVVLVPTGTLVVAASDRWEFDFDGSLAGGVGPGIITVSSSNSLWTINVARATGTVSSVKVAL